MKPSTNNHANLIWNIAELLRGEYKQAGYGKVILPFTLLRRLDQALEPTKDAVLKKTDELKMQKIKNADPFLKQVTGFQFYNTSRLTLNTISEAHPRKDLENYLNGFSQNVRDIFDRYKFRDEILFLDEANLLLLVLQEFRRVDISPSAVSNFEMGLLFEELIRRFSELSNEEAGHHFTPREVIRLMVRIIFDPEVESLKSGGIVRRIYDPAAGTGGMLSVAEEYLSEINPKATLRAYGQELNDESYAICKADMLIKEEDVSNIVRGNTLSEDGHPDGKFEYMLSNPPFGVDWKKVQKEVNAEHKLGYNGRFGPGLPRVSDGALLFLMTLLSKMSPEGSRIAIVLNGSPLFTGGAGSGESEIRRWIIENDWLEAIIGLPKDMFYNTGISTYIWVLSNKKEKNRKGKVQLINATGLFKKMQKSLGDKRNYLGEDDIERILNIYSSGGKKLQGSDQDLQRVFDNTDFGYNRITVERPLRLRFALTPEALSAFKESPEFGRWRDNVQDAILKALKKLKGSEYQSREDFFDAVLAHPDVGALTKGQKKLLQSVFGVKDESAAICTDDDGNPEPDADLRDYENVPLKEDIDEYFKREVLPHVPDAWIDPEKTVKGYEIPFNRHFYEYVPPRPLAEIDADIRQVESEILELLQVGTKSEK